ncbi:MAG TPA: lysophospholipid acyltransferase family protein [Smithella sp.]|nr:lysophospholipid acyltransferase family protein [Smithella sp.]
MTIEKTRTTDIILFIGRCVPLIVRKGFFKMIFWLFYHMVAKSRLIVLHNLQRSFPEKDLKEIIKIAKGVYRHFSIVAAEFFDLPSITRENIDKWVEVEGMENADAALALNKGALSIVAHFGNWELLTIAIPMLVRPMYIVYRPLDSPVFDNMVEYVRTMQGNSLIPKGGSGKKVLELLKENQIIGILSDQNVAAYEGVFVDFFGRPACTGVGLAVMAMRSGTPVVPVFMARQRSGKYKLIIKPAVETVCTDDYKSDLFVNTQRFTKIVEDVIREYPDQWFWFHQRWKTKTYQK